MPQRQMPRGGPRPRPRSGRRPTSGGGPSPRVLIAVALVLVTLVGGYWFLLRPGSAPSGDFAQAEEKIVTAAAQVPAAGAEVHRFLQLEPFYVAVQAQLVIIDRGTLKLRKVAKDSDGSAAIIAGKAATASTRISSAVTAYRTAITNSFNLADAQTALVDLESSVSTLEQQARAWKKL